MTTLDTFDYKYDNDSYPPLDYVGSDDRSISFFIIFLIPFIVGAISVFGIRGLNFVVIGLGTVCAAAYLIATIRGRIAFPKELLLFAAFFCWGFCGIFIAEAPILFFARLRTLFQFLVMVAVITGSVRNLRTTRILLLTVLLGCLIVAASAYVSGEYTRAEIFKGERVTGLGLNANVFAMTLVYAAVVILYFFKTWKSLILKGGCIIALLVMGRFIIASGSREGFFSFLLLLFFWYVFSYKKEMFRHPFTFIVIGLVIVAVGVSFYLSIADTTMGRRLAEAFGGVDISVRSRLDFYNIGFEIIADKPLFGVGLENYRIVEGVGTYSHSNYIEIFATTGIPGGIIYYAIFIVLWLRLRRLGKMPLEPKAMALVNTAKALWFIRLAGDFVRVSYHIKLNWILLAILIGWTYQLEQKMKTPALAKYDEAVDEFQTQTGGY
ncbi:MAG: O-antigen ligase family protein [Planctomycetota bacterium]|jgi:O-antigen ligase